MCPAETYEVCRVATNLPAHQSSVWSPLQPSSSAARYRRTNVELPDTPDSSCSMTDNETNPWWVVDLGISLTVTGVYYQPGTRIEELPSSYQASTE